MTERFIKRLNRKLKGGRCIVVICAVLLLCLLAGCGDEGPILGQPGSFPDTGVGNSRIPSGTISVIDNPGVFVEEAVVSEDDSEASDELSKNSFAQRAQIGIDQAGIEKIKLKQKGKYCYEIMDVQYQDLYAEIYGIIMAEAEDVRLSTTNVDAIKYVFNCVLNDHPEIYWVNGYVYTKHETNGVLVDITFTGKYIYSLEEREELDRKIESYVFRCFTGISKDASDFEKTKYIYEYIIEKTDYDLNARDNQNILSVFIYGSSVCQGYAKAVQYLLEKLDVQTSFISGKVYTGEGHAWNLVRIDGEYYYLDATWGDASYVVDGKQLNNYDIPINYDYLNITTDELLKTHSVNNIVPVPECTSLQANYYIHENLLFYDYQEDDIRTLFANGYARGDKVVTIKCASEYAYNMIYAEMIDRQKIFQFLAEGSQSISYTVNPDSLSFNFWL